MPLIIGRKGGYVLVCINGCVLPKTTKGLRALVTRADYEQAASPSDPQPPHPTPLPKDLDDYKRRIAEEYRRIQEAARAGPEQTTMRMAHGWNAITVVKPPTTMPTYASAIGAGNPAPVGPQFVPGEGSPVKLFICEVCGYCEMYAGMITDPQIWGVAEKTEMPRG